ncbi:MAG TPA: molybdopterin molybdenumtransferase MoeA, partial [Bacillota bacterium]|nr:molybdopterin molybdenumtransferase MoeA [Bacillota bacterium]
MALFGRRKQTADPETGTDDHAPAPAEDDTPVAPPVGPGGMRSVDDHRDFLLSLVDELPPFGQQILDALDLTLCEDVVSEVDLPAFDNSAMDGYAVQVADLVGARDPDPVVLAVVGEVAAGQTAPTPLSPGTAMKVMTGAPIPPGAEAVVPYEDTDRGADDVLVYREAATGQHIRRRGEDLSSGTQVFSTGDRLGPGSIGLLAAIGHDKAMV